MLLNNRYRPYQVRSRKQQDQLKKNEERLHASLLRSQLPVHKKTGKQIMFRSPPLHEPKKAREGRMGLLWSQWRHSNARICNLV